MLSLSIIRIYHGTFSSQCYRDHRDLHSFPTRRSSDLKKLREEQHKARAEQLAQIEEAQANEQWERTARRQAKVESILLERSEEHTSELQSRRDLVCRLLLEKKNILVNMLMEVNFEY